MRTAQVWYGQVVTTSPGGFVLIHDPRWPDDCLPAVGLKVEIHEVDRSPYWSLVEDDQGLVLS